MVLGAWASGDSKKNDAGAQAAKKSKRGPPGPAGPQGAAGAQGAQGAPGPPGAPNPNAQTLDGIASTGFVRGNGRVVARDETVFASGTPEEFLFLPNAANTGNLGELLVKCTSDASAVTFDYKNTSGVIQHVWSETAGGAVGQVDVANNGFRGETAGANPQRITLQIGGNEGHAATITAYGSGDNGSHCRFTAQAVISYDA
jgi:hypothetical protein